MEKLNFTLILIIVLVLLGIIGYWSVTSLQSGSEHKLYQKIDQLEEQNKELKEETENLEKDLATAESRLEELEPKEELPSETDQPLVEKPQATPSKYDTIIGELQVLINDKIMMKVGSRGTRVGTVQRFLNIYNGTSNRVDNDYGQGMKIAVIAFQKAQGVTADGEAGPGTFQKMIY